MSDLRRERRRVTAVTEANEAPIGSHESSNYFDHEQWARRLHEELEDIRAAPGGEDVFDDYKRRSHLGLAAIVGWLNEHPIFSDGELTDPIHLLAMALSAPDGKRHPITSPSAVKRSGRPRLEATVQRVFTQNVLVAVRILEAAGRDRKAACEFMSIALGVAKLTVAPKTIESWDDQAGSQTPMGKAISTALDSMYAERADLHWPPSKAKAEAKAREIAQSDHLKYLAWGVSIRT